MGKRYKIDAPEGHFVPGLPAEISIEEAEEQGLGKILKDCIELKLYKPIKASAKPEKEQ